MSRSPCDAVRCQFKFIPEPVHDADRVIIGLIGRKTFFGKPVSRCSLFDISHDRTADVVILTAGRHLDPADVRDRGDPFIGSRDILCEDPVDPDLIREEGISLRECQPHRAKCRHRKCRDLDGIHEWLCHLDTFIVAENDISA